MQYFKNIKDRNSLHLRHRPACNLVLFDVDKRFSSISFSKCRLRTSISWPAAAPPSDSHVSCPTVPRMSLSRRMSSTSKGHQSWSRFDFVSFALIFKLFSSFQSTLQKGANTYTYCLSILAFKSSFFIGKF